MQQCATPILPSKEESTANAQLVDILRNRAQTPAHVRHSAVEHDLLPASSVSGPYDTAQLSQLVGKTNLAIATGNGEILSGVFVIRYGVK